MAEPVQPRELLPKMSAVILAGLLAIFAMIFANQSAAVESVERATQGHLLGLLAGKNARAKAMRSVPEPATLSLALKTQPLNPVLVNAAMFVRAASAKDNMARPNDMAILARLGWRSTRALQNRVTFAVGRRDLSGIVDIADALLRRNQLVEQGQALLVMMESAPQTRQQALTTLARNPGWREAYFQSRIQPQNGTGLAARAQIIAGLAARGAPLSRDELRVPLAQLVDNGYARAAYGFWRAYRKAVPAMAMNDPDFRWAYALRDQDPNGSLPFEWRIYSGPGYWGELMREQGKTMVRVNWNRKGIPFLLTQKLYVGNNGGRFQLRVEGVDLPSDMLDDFSFALYCPKSRIMFDTAVVQGKGGYTLESNDTLACANPQFAVTGRPFQIGRMKGSASVVDAAEGVSLTLTRIALKRI